MLTSGHRYLIIQTIIILMTGLASCQPKNPVSETDAITKLAVHYLNGKMPDSLYKLTDKDFSKRITPAAWISSYEEKVVPLLPLSNVTFITNSDSVSIYKVDGKVPLTLYVSIDKQGKLHKFYFAPYQDEVKSVTLSESEQKTDLLARKVLNLINRRQADSVYLLAGDDFKKHIDAIRWNNVAKNIFWLTPLPQAVFLRSENGVNIYSMRPYEFMFGGIDKNGKFNAFAMQAYPENAVKTQKAGSDNKLITHLDSVVDKVIRAYIQTEGNVGISAAVFYKGHSYFYNYGERKKGGKQLPDAHTIYDIGSVTKTFTSTLLAIAVNQRKLTLETPITKFLPDSVVQNPALKNITFKELANHTSGFPFQPDNVNRKITDANQPFENYGSDDMFSALKHFKQTGQPGTEYAYSNWGLAVLGLLLEKIYNHPYPELIKQYITIPLKMTETMCAIDTLKTVNVAKGYGKLFEPVPFIKIAAFRSSGVIKSSAFDMLEYAQAQLSTPDHALTSAINLTHQITFDNGAYTVGLGWGYASDDKNVISHNGGTVGYHSNVSIDLSKQIAVVVLTNNVTAGDAVGVNLMKAIQAIKN